MKITLTKLFRARDYYIFLPKQMRMNDMGREKRLLFVNFLPKAI